MDLNYLEKVFPLMAASSQHGCRDKASQAEEEPVERKHNVRIEESILEGVKLGIGVTNSDLGPATNTGDELKTGNLERKLGKYNTVTFPPI